MKLPLSIPLSRPRPSGPDPSGPAIAIVAGPGWHADIAAGKFDFFTHLQDHARARGVPVDVHADAPGFAQGLADQGQAVIVIGPRQPVGPGILHAHPAYVWGFWYLDPQGVNYASSLGDRAFDATAIDGPDWFFNGVAGWMTRTNLSKFPQAPRATLPPVPAVFFAQEIEGYRHPVHHLTTAEIIAGVAAVGGLVKPHPAMSPEGLARLSAMVAAHPGLALTGASVHDLIAAAGVVVTQNSAAGFEALLQSRPVITCARCDYARATLAVRNPRELATALREAPARMAGFPYPAFVAWFLRDQCLEPAQDDFAARAWARLRAVARLPP